MVIDSSCPFYITTDADLVIDSSCPFYITTIFVCYFLSQLIVGDCEVEENWKSMILVPGVVILCSRMNAMLIQASSFYGCKFKICF
ncbi:hypothetical protein P8452_41872 [Trifolium repens]|nr:hypothetical protein QL285_031574 [Trifolium repens]WJX56192.1 hypothetical protein P8452_41872 [Trifolium repens]